MAITPITNLTYAHKNISFGTRERDDGIRNDRYYSPSRNSSSLKRVPVMVLIAMSPINSSSVAPYSPVSVPENIEMVQQAGVKKGIVFRKEIKLNDQQIRILGMNKDDNKSNYERIGFNYDCKKNGRHGRLNGAFTAICKQPTGDGRYLIAYEEILPGGESSNFKLCYLPNLFGEYVSTLATSFANNNAMAVLPKSEFVEYFGKDNVENAPSMKAAVHTYIDD